MTPVEWSDSACEGEHMKCRNCGLPRSAHTLGAESEGREVWLCPDGSGGRFPSIVDYKIEIRYRAGEEFPWLAKWSHPTGGVGQVVAERAGDALERAGRAIEESFEEKSPDQETIEEAIKS